MAVGNPTTVPYCGACGHGHEAFNIMDTKCDACGADVAEFHGFSNTATAGAPGSFDGGAPENLAALIRSGIVASPTSAWTVGQSVVLRDGNDAHWDGTGWVTGTA